jgi:hypothetical protein
LDDRLEAGLVHRALQNALLLRQPHAKAEAFFSTLKQNAFRSRSCFDAGLRP